MFAAAWTRLSRPSSRACRALSTTPTEGGWRSWTQKKKDGIIHIFFSGTLFVMSIQLVNLRHRADDTEAELRQQLRDADRARQTLLSRVPALARDAGLPADAESRFEASLEALAVEVTSVPDLASSAASQASVPPTARSGTGASASVPSEAKPHHKAVW